MMCLRRRMAEPDLTRDDDNPLYVLRALKGMGATLSNHPGFRLLSFVQLRRLTAYYHETFADSDGKVPATYRVLYLCMQMGN